MEPITLGLIALGKVILAKAGVTGAVSAFTAGAVGAGAIAGTIAVMGMLVYISYLVLSDLTSWFREKRHYKNSSNHAFSFKAQLESSKRVTVQGIFNSDGDPVSTSSVRTIEYGSISPELENLHRERIVEYT